MSAELLQIALALHQDGQIDQAEAFYRQIIASEPGNHDALHLLGMAAHQRGRHREAAELIGAAIALRPGEPLFHNNLGVVLQGGGRIAEAEAAYRRALELNPRHAAALNNLGNILRDSWRLDDAADCYRRALEIQPAFAEALNNLGNIHADQRNYADAIIHYRRAISVQPDYTEAWKNLGILLLEEGETAQAAAAFDRARDLRPHDSGLKLRAAFAMPVIPESAAEIQLRREQLAGDIDRLMREPLHIEDPVRNTCGPVFHLAYQGMNDRDLQARIAALYAKATPSLRFMAAHCIPGMPMAAANDGRVHVGILSRFLHNHSIGDHYAGLIRSFPKRVARYTVFRFPGPFDDVTKKIEAAVESLITLSTQLAEAREQIAAQRLDVLFYTDIGMDPWTYFLAFSRLAPVQCVTLGQPVTTGIPTIDYFLSFDQIESEQSESHYTEQLVRLRNMPHYFAKPALGSSTKSRRDFGIPDDVPLYVCPQTLFKFHPDFDGILGEILRRDARGLIVIFEAGRPNWTKLLSSRIERSVGTLFSRVRFLARQPYDDFLRILQLADVLLDTPHFSGGTTTLQALAVGAPLVTLPGEFARGRGTRSHYMRIGVTDTLARDAAHYVELAVAIANDASLRSAIRQRILAAGSVLFDSPAAAIELEQFFADSVASYRQRTKHRSPHIAQGAA